MFHKQNSKENFEIIARKNNLTYEKLAEMADVDRKTIMINIAILKEKNLIRRMGSARAGYWEIIE